MPRLAASALRSGEMIPDAEFDRVFPPPLRLVSRQHWTPVAVAARAARLLVENGAKRILDVGCGPGKFCMVGGLTTDATFVGIEQREHLVEAGRRAAGVLGVRRVHLVVGNIADFDFEGFDGLYLYNPFYEQVCTAWVPIDDRVVASPQLYKRYVVLTARKLASARPGTVVATYHGFGGEMPCCYQRVHEDAASDGRLVVWIKES
jgi:SAM-dependent methyltransferase